MKPAVTKLKNARGRITGYEAKRGPIQAHGDSPAEASDKCEKAVTAALRRLEDGVRILSFRGHVAFVYPSTECWHYWIEGFRAEYACSVSTPGTTIGKASCEALHHLAQNVWTAVDDDAAFLEDLDRGLAPIAEAADRMRCVGEMRRWLVFQRAYAAARADGATDEEAHRLGCEASSRAPM